MFSFGKLIQLIEKDVVFSGRFLKLQNEAGSYSKINVPAPPKRPLTAFLLYCQSNRKYLRKDKSFTAPQQTKILAEQWGNLTPESKKTYEDLARKDTIAYGQKHKEYYEDLTEEQREELSRVKAEKKESLRLFRFRKALKESGIPKQPKSAYAIYLQSNANETKNFKSLSEYSKAMSSKWRGMSENERQIYVDLSKEGRNMYVVEMNKWREKLVESGKLDLLKAYDERKLKGKTVPAESSGSKSQSMKKKKN